MLLGFKTGLRPTPTQAAALAQHAGYQRWAYNRMWEKLAAARDAGASLPSPMSLAKELRRERPEWAMALSQNVFDNARLHLSNALTRHRDCAKGKHDWHKPGSCGFPTPSSKRQHDGFTASDGHSERIRVEGRRVLIPKVGWIPMAEELPAVCWVKQVHVSRVAGRWFVAFNYEDGKELPDAPGGDRCVGIDVGVKMLVMTSDGAKEENPKPLHGALRKLRRLDKSIARSKNVHGKDNTSRRRIRLYRRRAKLHAKVANIRKDTHRRIAATIAKRSDVVVVESLNVRGMLRNDHLARSITDAALGGLLKEISWQCAKRGVKLIEAGQWFPSTQICARCGERPERRVTLGARWYSCAHCGWECDRDENAAINLMKLAHAFGESLNGRRGNTSPPACGSARDAVEASRESHNQPALMPTLARG